MMTPKGRRNFSPNFGPTENDMIYSINVFLQLCVIVCILIPRCTIRELSAQFSFLIMCIMVYSQLCAYNVVLALCAVLVNIHTGMGSYRRVCVGGWGGGGGGCCRAHVSCFVDVSLYVLEWHSK